MNMYARYIGLIILSIAFNGCQAQEKAEKVKEVIAPGYKIDITVNNFAGARVTLANYFGEKPYKADSATVENGHFVFEGEEALPQGMYLVVLPPKSTYFEIIVGEDQHFSLQTDTLNFVSNMKVEGSEENEVFYKDLVYLADQRAKVNEIQEELKTVEKDSDRYKELVESRNQVNTEVMTYREELMNSKPDHLYPKMLRTMKEPTVPPAPDGADSLYAFHYYRAHFFDNVDLNDQRLLRTPILHQKIDTYIERLTYKHPDSINKSIDYIIGQTQDTLIFRYLVQTFLNKYAASKIMGMDAVYVHMVEHYYMKGLAYWSDQENLEKMTERALSISPTLIGRKAPGFSMQDMNGKMVSLHDIKAKYTILYFWDYDCGHCKKVTPQLAEAYKKYIDKDVQLVTVSINGAIDIWKEKVAEYGIKGIPLADPYRKSGFDAKYDIRSTPRLFLLDEDKIIKAKHITVEQMEELLDRLLGDS